MLSNLAPLVDHVVMLHCRVCQCTKDIWLADTHPMLIKIMVSS